MKRHHLTTLTAIAIVAALLVVLRTMKAPEEDPHSAEELAILKQRQAERHQESKRRREASRKRTSLDYVALKEELLTEFPNLRADPPLPNKENPIFLLNELALELLGEESTFRSDLKAAIGPYAKWDLQQAQALLEKYSATLERLDAIGSMKQNGSNAFEGDWVVGDVMDPIVIHDNDTSPEKDALMLFLDLLRLRARVEFETGKISERRARQRTLSGLPLLMHKTRGLTFMQSRILEMHRFAKLDSPMDREMHNHLRLLSKHGRDMSDWHLTNWGLRINSNILADQVRTEWERQLEWGDLSALAKNQDEAVIRVYSAQLSLMIDQLGKQSIQEFHRSPPAEFEQGNLSAEQHHLAKTLTDSAYDELRSMMIHATKQHLEGTAIALRRYEQLGAAIDPTHISALHFHPITGTRMSYDYDTRTLMYHDSIGGQSHVGIVLHPPDEGSLTDPGRYFSSDE